MTITKAEDITDDRHNSSRGRVKSFSTEPKSRIRELFKEPFREDKWESRDEAFEINDGGKFFIRESINDTCLGDVNITSSIGISKNFTEGNSISKPFNKTTLIIEWSNSISFDREAGGSGMTIIKEKTTDHGVKKGDTIIFTEIILRFTKESIGYSITTKDTKFFGSLKGGYDINIRENFRDSRVITIKSVW